MKSLLMAFTSGVQFVLAVWLAVDDIMPMSIIFLAGAVVSFAVSVLQRETR